MNTIEQMEQLLQEMRLDAQKLYQGNTKAYAVRLREKAQQMKVLAQLVRTEALAHHNNIAGRGKNKTVGGVQIVVQASTEPEPQPSAIEPTQPISIPVPDVAKRRSKLTTTQ